MDQNSDNLLSAITNTELPEVLKEIAEIPLDAKLPEGLLKELPGLGTIFALYKTGISIKDYLFTKRLSLFLFEIYKIPPKERRRLVEKINRDDKQTTRMGEKILYLIEKFDDNEKPRLAAKAFRAYLNDNINFEELIRITHGIERVISLDLPLLEAFVSREEKRIRKVPYHIFQNLGDAGFIDIVSGWDDLLSQINELGEKFYKYVYSDSSGNSA